MTPKEKALELYKKFEDGITGVEGTDWWKSAEQCALIAVDEILSIGCVEVPYWYEVKQEIVKL
jgi:hypothetical protein